MTAKLKKTDPAAVTPTGKPKRVALHRAEVLTASQFKEALEHVRRSAHPLRDETLINLSFYAGLRVGEIAGLEWEKHILDAKGVVKSEVHITHDIGKRAVERTVPMHKDLRDVLKRLRASRPHDRYVIYALSAHRDYDVDRENRAPEGKTDPNTLTQYFRRLYQAIGFKGVTSHSGRRTFITMHARNANKVGASIVDVQHLAGHKRLQTTADYVELSPAQTQLVNSLYG